MRVEALVKSKRTGVDKSVGLAGVSISGAAEGRGSLAGDHCSSSAAAPTPPTPASLWQVILPVDRQSQPLFKGSVSFTFI